MCCCAIELQFNELILHYFLLYFLHFIVHLLASACQHNSGPKSIIKQSVISSRYIMDKVLPEQRITVCYGHLRPDIRPHMVSVKSEFFTMLEEFLSQKLTENFSTNREEPKPHT